MTVHAIPSAPDGASDIGEIARSQKPAHSLQQALYNSEAAFERDLELIFRRHWILAGHASMAPQPGDYFLAEAAAESIIVIRGRDGALRAFANVCRHRGSRICTRSQGHASVLVCPYHAWTYNLDGSLRSARYMPADFDKANYGLNEAVTLTVISPQPCYLNVFEVNAAGEARILFPNQSVQNNLVETQEAVAVTLDGSGASLRGAPGFDQFIAVCSSDVAPVSSTGYDFSQLFTPAGRADTLARDLQAAAVRLAGEIALSSVIVSVRN